MARHTKSTGFYRVAWVFYFVARRTKLFRYVERAPRELVASSTVADDCQHEGVVLIKLNDYVKKSLS